MAILQGVFQGLPRTNLENHLRPWDLGNLCLVNSQFKAEATEAYFTVGTFEVTILTAMQDVEVLHQMVDWGQPLPPGNPAVYTLREWRQTVRRAQLLWPSRRSRSWGAASYFRMSVPMSVPCLSHVV